MQCLHSNMSLEWWHWLVLGLILVALELAASGGFYVIFFGIAAVAIGALRLFDVAGPAWMQVLLFIVISVGALTLVLPANVPVDR